MSRNTLYVHRPLLNTEDLIDWAVHQGFSKTLDPDDMHATIAFSKKPVHWHRLTPHTDRLHIVGDQRAIVPLGDKGATVLQFFHPHLHHRWKEILSHGASWDHDGFRPHVTITYEPHNLDLHKIEPYRGPLVFGPEVFAPVVPDWDKRIREVPLVGENTSVLTGKRTGEVKYGKSITENNNMAESLASLLMKNIDLILEAYNVDQQGNLVQVNRKKVQETDEVFHNYFVKSMNRMFRQINENDPIMTDPDNMMSPMGGSHGMHRMGGEHMGHQRGGPMDGMRGDEMGMGREMGMGGEMGMGRGMGMEHDPMGMDEFGMNGTDEMLGDAMDNDMQMAGGDMGMRGAPGGGMGGTAMESAEYGWVFSEDADLDVDSLFNLTEEDDDEEEEGDDEEMEEGALNEFGMHPDQHMMDDETGGMGGSGMGGMGGGSMDLDGGANDFGGDMGGMGQGGMGQGGMDQGGMGGDDMMGGGDDMVSIHGTTDGGGEFEFSFDPETLGFGGDDMGGEMGGGEFGGHEHHGGHGSHHEGGEEHHMDQPGMGDEEEKDEEPPVAEAMMVKKGKPSKGHRGPRTARMGIVPADPATDHAAPFPTPQGTKQKRK